MWRACSPGGRFLRSSAIRIPFFAGVRVAVPTLCPCAFFNSTVVLLPLPAASRNRGNDIKETNVTRTKVWPFMMRSSCQKLAMGRLGRAASQNLKSSILARKGEIHESRCDRAAERDVNLLNRFSAGRRLGSKLLENCSQRKRAPPLGRPKEPPQFKLASFVAPSAKSAPPRRLNRDVTIVAASHVVTGSTRRRKNPYLPGPAVLRTRRPAGRMAPGV